MWLRVSGASSMLLKVSILSIRIYLCRSFFRQFEDADTHSHELEGKDSIGFYRYLSELLISTAAETHSHKEGGGRAHTKRKERRKKWRMEPAGVLVGLALLFCGADDSLVVSLWL